MSTVVMVTADTVERVTALLDDDWNLQQAASAAGVTREMARHIGEYYGGHVSADPNDYRSPRQIQLIRDVGEEVMNHIAGNLGDTEAGCVMTAEQVAAAFPNTSKSHIAAAIRDAQLEPLLYDQTTESRERFTDGMIHEALQQAAKGGAALSGEEYDMWRGYHREAPSRSLIIHRFGTWSQACVAAGVNVVTRKERGWTHDAMWDALHRFAEDMMRTDQPLTFGGYTGWARDDRGRSAPSGSTLKARLFQTTPWSTVRVMLIQHLYREHGHRWVRATPPLTIPDPEDTDITNLPAEATA